MSRILIIAVLLVACSGPAFAADPVADQLKTVAAQVADVVKQVSVLRTDVGVLRKDVDLLRKDVGELAKLTDRMKKLEDESAKKKAELEKQIKSLKAQVEDLRKKPQPPVVPAPVISGEFIGKWGMSTPPGESYAGLTAVVLKEDGSYDVVWQRADGMPAAWSGTYRAVAKVLILEHPTEASSNLFLHVSPVAGDFMVVVVKNEKVKDHTVTLHQKKK